MNIARTTFKPTSIRPSLFLSPCLSLSDLVSVSLSLHLCLSLSVCLSVSRSRSLSLSLTVSLFISLSSPSPCDSPTPLCLRPLPVQAFLYPIASSMKTRQPHPTVLASSLLGLGTSRGKRVPGFCAWREAQRNPGAVLQRHSSSFCCLGLT